MLVYNVCLYIRFNKAPDSTVMGVNHRARRAWVRSIMQDNEKKNILAVQTLRNSIMGSTLLATTAILLSSAVAAFLASSYDIKGRINSSIVGSQSNISLSVKYMTLLAGFLSAFLCYVQAVRYTNHVNFIINVPISATITPEYVADVLERGANFHTIGTRAFYVTIPLLLWIFGPIPFFASTVILVPMWHSLDAAQDTEAQKMRKAQMKAFKAGIVENDPSDHSVSHSISITSDKGGLPVCTML
ncbi:hypothetical protein AXG93_150s1200 [Marchantia polymorpha subsp. ruderalis]|nr:hypothetical protein AXG93_150s1200 [Marchantia polymorpha subsp. ruderalis]